MNGLKLLRTVVFCVVVSSLFPSCYSYYAHRWRNDANGQTLYRNAYGKNNEGIWKDLSGKKYRAVFRSESDFYLDDAELVRREKLYRMRPIYVVHSIGYSVLTDNRERRIVEKRLVSHHDDVQIPQSQFDSVMNVIDKIEVDYGHEERYSFYTIWIPCLGERYFY